MAAEMARRPTYECAILSGDGIIRREDEMKMEELKRIDQHRKASISL